MKRAILNVLAAALSLSIWLPNVAHAATIEEGAGNDAIVIGNDIVAWEWLSPGILAITSGESVTYNVGSWKETGISRTEIYANGTLTASCIHGHTLENANCSMVIETDEYLLDTDIEINAKVAD